MAMTVQEWQQSHDGFKMSLTLHDQEKITGRNYRALSIFALECLERIQPLLTTDEIKMVDAAARHVRGEMPEEERQAQWMALARNERNPHQFYRDHNRIDYLRVYARHIAGRIINDSLHAADVQEWVQGQMRALSPMEIFRDGCRSLSVVQDELKNTSAFSGFIADSLRHALGPNPFQPRIFDPSWRTEAVVGLVRSIERENAYDRLPVVADALDDAGCTDPAILDRCRDTSQPGRYGLWVLEDIMGRSNAVPPPTVEVEGKVQRQGNGAFLE